MSSKILQEWPEPIVRVQALSESGLAAIPDRYVKPPTERPTILDQLVDDSDSNIPIIDLSGLFEQDRAATLSRISGACREWGFFQVISHGVGRELMDSAREVWREFFHASMEVKQAYANSPTTYEGYGSRLGVQKGAILDWSDYFFLHFRPNRLLDPQKMALLLPVMEEYGEEVAKLCVELLKALSVKLGLDSDELQEGLRGEEIGACLRVNYYPKCPEPELTLGLSSHSDPGGITVLLPDPQVAGLQVRRGDWKITVNPAPHAFVVNIGDQIQVLSNANYKSVEHRVIVNSNVERISLAFFYNPRSDILIRAMDKLVTTKRPALYSPMTFDEYRRFIRLKGPRGKSQVEALKSTRCSA